MNDSMIGGRDTNISQIAYSLLRVTKVHFPINGVPDELVAAYSSLKDILENGEKEIINYVKMLNAHGVGRETDY